MYFNCKSKNGRCEKYRFCGCLKKQLSALLHTCDVVDAVVSKRVPCQHQVYHHPYITEGECAFDASPEWNRLAQLSSESFLFRFSELALLFYGEGRTQRLKNYFV